MAVEKHSSVRKVNFMRTEEVVLDGGDKSVYTYNDAGVILRTIDYDAEVTFSLTFNTRSILRTSYGALDRLQRFLYDENHQRIEDQHFEGPYSYGAKGSIRQ